MESTEPTEASYNSTNPNTGINTQDTATPQTVQTATWPSSLQQCLDANTLNITEDPQYLTTDMDRGPKKSRRVITRGFQKIKCSIFVNKEQYIEFLRWWNNDIAGGAGAFYFAQPITGVPTTYKFEKPYALTPVGPRNWRLTFEWIEVSI